MGEKHDAMWGVEAGERIAQLEAELARLRADNERQYNVMVDAYGQLLHGGTKAHMRNAMDILQKYFAERRAALAPDGKGHARCPRCNSPKQELHPAVQYEGEVQMCSDPWHVAPNGKGGE